MEKYKYEVAFSFLKQDEAIAFDLNDRIQDRLTTFIYSKKQEELGGTDGEKIFNKVFFEESRVVVVLYRDGWGSTPWTSIEELAIKNRAFGKDWNFLLLINLDTKSTMPSWIPKAYIWLDYPRFKAEGAIAVIEQKVKETGGQPKPESIQDRAERLKRGRNAQNERELFLVSNEAVTMATKEINTLITKFKETKSLIEDPTSNLYLTNQSRSDNPPMYALGYKGYYLCFNNSTPFMLDYNGSKLKNLGILRVLFFEGEGHHGINYKEKVLESTNYQFDRDLVGNIGWSELDTGNNFMSTDELLDKWVKRFMDNLGDRK